MNGGFVHIDLALLDSSYYSIVRSCKGTDREDGIWRYEKDTLYLQITKSTGYYDSTKLEKYIPIAVNSCLVLAPIYDSKKYRKQVYKEIRSLQQTDFNETSRGFLYKKLSK